MNPRDSLYGGRINIIRLFCTEGDMRYVDVCSPYPYVLKYRPFPVGHPEILTDNFGDLRAYFGLIKCRVLPPRGLYHPPYLIVPEENYYFPYVGHVPNNDRVWNRTINVCILNLNAVSREPG